MAASLAHRALEADRKGFAGWPLAGQAGLAEPAQSAAGSLEGSLMQSTKNEWMRALGFKLRKWRGKTSPRPKMPCLSQGVGAVTIKSAW